MVEMGCNDWDTGLTSSGISVSLFITMHAQKSPAPCISGKSSETTTPSSAEVATGKTELDHRLPFLSNIFKFHEHSAYCLLHFFLQRPTN